MITQLRAAAPPHVLPNSTLRQMTQGAEAPPTQDYMAEMAENKLQANGQDSIKLKQNETHSPLLCLFHQSCAKLLCSHTPRENYVTVCYIKTTLYITPQNTTVGSHQPTRNQLE